MQHYVCNTNNAEIFVTKEDMSVKVISCQPDISDRIFTQFSLCMVCNPFGSTIAAASHKKTCA